MRETNKVQIALWPTIALLVGLVLIYVGERAISDGKLHWAVNGVGGALVLAGFVGRILSLTGTSDENHKRAEGWLLAAYGAVIAGLATYFLITEGKTWLKDAFGKGYDRFDGMSSLLWPALIIGGTLPALLMQTALQGMTDGHGRAEHVEKQRVAYSAQSGLTVALVLIFCFAVNYVASERNAKWDMARFRSTRPSESTRKIIENLNKPFRAILFMPAANEVREQVVPYFESLQKVSSKFDFRVVDHALEPVLAKEVSATGNGLLILGAVDEKDPKKLAQKETLHIGVTLESAGSVLGTFDGDVQKRLLQLTRPGRIAYFTVGHGERTFDRFSSLDTMKEDLRAPVGGLQQMLLGQGYEVKTLSVAQGLAQKVPGDAGIVFIPGPTEHFLPEEVSSLVTYLNGGGHVFVMLDPSSEVAATDLAPLLKAGGIKFHPQVLANKESFWPRLHQASDVLNVGASSYSSHASITTLSRVSGRVPVILPRVGWFERETASPAGVSLDFTIRTPPGTWIESKLNFERDADEKEQVFEVCAAASKPIGDAKDKKEMRLYALASVDAVSDLVLGYRPNQALLFDSIKWLMGDDAIVGEVAQETDQPIVHTKSEDKAWFYLTVMVVPGVILALGMLYTRRIRRKWAS